jgi:hypothetical protein
LGQGSSDRDASGDGSFGFPSGGSFLFDCFSPGLPRFEQLSDPTAASFRIRIPSGGISDRVLCTHARIRSLEFRAFPIPQLCLIHHIFGGLLSDREMCSVSLKLR